MFSWFINSNLDNYRVNSVQLHSSMFDCFHHRHYRYGTGTAAGDLNGGVEQIPGKYVVII